jgi:hypothetical protein
MAALLVLIDIGSEQNSLKGDFGYFLDMITKAKQSFMDGFSSGD